MNVLQVVKMQRDALRFYKPNYTIENYVKCQQLFAYAERFLKYKKNVMYSIPNK